MHSFLISDNRDSLVGMRMAGIDGVLINTPEEALNEMQDAIENKEIGILFFTEKAADMIEEKILDYRKKSLFPLITIIPDRHGFKNKKGISEYITDSIGV